MLGPQGIVAGAREGLVVIDTTTAQPASTLRPGLALAAEGVRFCRYAAHAHARAGRGGPAEQPWSAPTTRSSPISARYCTHPAEAVGSTAFPGEAVHRTFTLALAQGEGEADVPAIARGLARANGVRLGPKE
jgi:3-hydroxyisobutyrate dehydrogenase-like beta-hydroxyacid dehydrogenase